MKQDKALKRALQKRTTSGLPYGFENRIMRQVFVEVEKKKKRSFIWGISAISLVSAGMIASAIFILQYFYSFSIRLNIPPLVITTESQKLLGFCCYIGLLVLALLGLDEYFRRLRQKRHEKQS